MTSETAADDKRKDKERGAGHMPAQVPHSPDTRADLLRHRSGTGMRDNGRVTKSPLPEITLTCADGHTFTTRAAGGSVVRCKTCRRSKHVPVDRPRTAREAAAYVAPGSAAPAPQDAAGAEPEPGSELAGRWEAEAEWSGGVDSIAGGSAACSKCGTTVQWEPRRTLTWCPQCKRLDLPPAVSAYQDRQQAERAQVAVRQVADPVAERAARARLRALREDAESWAEDWIDTLGDPDSYDLVQWQREARAFAATLRGWIPEIKSAASEAEINEIKKTIIREVIQDGPGRELRDAYDASLQRAKQAEEREQYLRQVEESRAQREAEEQAEERRQQAEYERQQRELRKPAAPRAITATPKPPDAAVMIASLIEQNRKNKAARAAKIERNGQCEWCKKPTPATRAYGVGYQQNGWGRGSNDLVLALDRPNARACPKHYAQAGQRAEQQNPGVKTYYWELT